MARTRAEKDYWKPIKDRLSELATDKMILNQRQIEHRKEVITAIAEAQELEIPITHIAECYQVEPIQIYRILKSK